MKVYRPMADLKVVPLHDGRPSLNDVPARLRLLADQIEAGEYGEAVTLLALITRPADWPVTFGFGDIDGQNDPIIQFELAKMLHCQMMMGRT